MHFTSKLLKALLIIFCFTLSFHMIYEKNISFATPMHKENLPMDPRPLPKNASDWKKIQKMDDPLTNIQFENKMDAHALSNPPWDRLKWGDIVLGRGKNGKLNSIPYGYFRHTGMWHFDEKKLLSATPEKGVYFQTQIYWNKVYPRIEFLTVDKLEESTKKEITEYATKQLGKPYYISKKRSSISWYCSKLPWAAYNRKGVDIDSKKAYIVTPDNIYYSPYTRSIFRRV